MIAFCKVDILIVIPMSWGSLVNVLIKSPLPRTIEMGEVRG